MKDLVLLAMEEMEAIGTMAGMAARKDNVMINKIFRRIENFQNKAKERLIDEELRESKLRDMPMGK